MNSKGTRRPNGSGSIFQRKNGLWEAQYTVGFDLKTGKQIRKSIYGKSQAEVRKKLAEVEVKLDNGTYVAPQKITVAEWLDIWMKEYTGNIKSSTRASYEQHIRVHIKPYIGRFKLSALTPQIIQTFYKCEERSKRSCHTSQIPGDCAPAGLYIRKSGRYGNTPPNGSDKNKNDGQRGTSGLSDRDQRPQI